MQTVTPSTMESKLNTLKDYIKDEEMKAKRNITSSNSDFAQGALTTLGRLETKLKEIFQV